LIFPRFAEIAIQIVALYERPEKKDVKKGGGKLRGCKVRIAGRVREESGKKLRK
jgi:hypothetical protein